MIYHATFTTLEFTQPLHWIKIYRIETCIFHDMLQILWGNSIMLKVRLCQLHIKKFQEHVHLQSNAYIMKLQSCWISTYCFWKKIDNNISMKFDQIGKVVFARVFGLYMAMTRQQPLGGARAPLRQVWKVSKITSNTHWYSTDISTPINMGIKVVNVRKYIFLRWAIWR